MAKKSSSIDEMNTTAEHKQPVIAICDLQPGEALPFPLFRNAGQHSDRWREAGVPFSKEELTRLRMDGLTVVYAVENHQGAWARFLNQRLHMSMTNSGAVEPRHLSTAMAAGRAIAQYTHYTPHAVDGPVMVARWLKYIEQIIPNAPSLKSLWSSSRKQFFADHAVNTAILSFALGHEIQLGTQSCSMVAKAAFFHDLGEHVDTLGGDRDHPAASIGLLGIHGTCHPLVREAILHHHERLDGSGGPLGLTGADIGWSARLLAVVDVFDAASCPSKQQKPTSITGMEYLLAERGNGLDLEMVNGLQEIYSRGRCAP